MLSQLRPFAVGLVALCVSITLAPAVSGQVCDSGPASVDADGVGNEAAKAVLLAPTTADCSTYIDVLGGATAFEQALGETAIIALAFECAGDSTVEESTFFTFDSDYEPDAVPGPTGGWNTISGTYNDAIVTSIGGFGTASGAACRELPGDGGSLPCNLSIGNCNQSWACARALRHLA